MQSTIVKVDARNRISLGRAIKHLSSLYRVYEENDRIILDPIRETRDHWIFKPENKHLLEKLERGLKQECKNDLGAFDQYLEDDKV